MGVGLLIFDSLPFANAIGQPLVQVLISSRYNTYVLNFTLRGYQFLEGTRNLAHSYLALRHWHH